MLTYAGKFWNLLVFLFEHTSTVDSSMLTVPALWAKTYETNWGATGCHLNQDQYGWYFSTHTFYTRRRYQFLAKKKKKTGSPERHMMSGTRSFEFTIWKHGRRHVLLAAVQFASTMCVKQKQIEHMKASHKTKRQHIELDLIWLLWSFGS